MIKKENLPRCPDCKELFDDEDGAQYFPDRFVKRELNNLAVTCPFSEAGCDWEGKFSEYEKHVNRCSFAMSSCEYCKKSIYKNQLTSQKLHMAGAYSEHMRQEKVILQEMNKPNIQSIDQDLSRIVRNEIETLRRKMFATLTETLERKDEELASLRTQVTKLEKQMRSKNTEPEDRDFRLSLIENSNHDGTMIWKIPQFSQRKADAENGKCTSIFSLPFFTGRYGYKMCLRLYIMGDGIGKGTHLSLFFVVMRGEFDNILQWPFAHRVTFKLINQAGGRDIVDMFHLDPMNSPFRKPESDMNIARGFPQFVSHTELERGGFIVDDTIFIECIVNCYT